MKFSKSSVSFFLSGVAAAQVDRWMNSCALAGLGERIAVFRIGGGLFAPGFDLSERDANGLDQVADRQPVLRVKPLKTAGGNTAADANVTSTATCGFLFAYSLRDCY